MSKPIEIIPIENKMKEAVQKIPAPAPEIILENVQDKIKNRQTPANAFMLVAAAVCMLFVAYFVPLLMGGNAPLAVGGYLIPLQTTEFVIGHHDGIYQGLLIVSRNEGDEALYGLIDMYGEIVIPPEYSFILPFFLEGVTMATRHVYDELIFEAIDKENNPVIFEIDGERINFFMSVFMDGYATVTTGFNLDTPTFIINREGEVILREEDYAFLNIGNGLFLKSSAPFNIFPTNETTYLVTVDTYGNIVFDKGIWLTYFPSLFDPYTTFYSKIPLGNLSDITKYGIFNLTNNTFVTDEIISTPTAFSNGRAIVEMYTGEIVIIDHEGNRIAELSEIFYPAEAEIREYAWLNNGIAPLHFSCGKPPVIINSEGEIIAETNFDGIRMFSDENIAVFEKDGLFGYVDSHGRIIFPPEFDFATNLYNGVSFVRRGDNQYRFKIGA
ncbi:MAG: WG repeat-containing protein [Defluviitaleaceae bacterium]|nr:WG repeat-containing protein [Defluviitaleaceae bacterium]